MAEFTLTSDGSTGWFRCRSDTIAVQVYGSSGFGGGTLTIEKQDDQGAAQEINSDGSAVSITAPDGFGLIVGDNEIIRATLSGSTSPSITGSFTSADGVVNKLP